mgnify:CR=1 FL=1
MSRGWKGNLLLVAAVAAVAWFAQDRFVDGVSASSPVAREVGSTQGETDAVIAEAYESQRNSLQVEGRGTVSRLLADDNNGSRHQRFILRLGSGQTLLVAHNIDLAPRIDGLEVGDEVAFYGEYEWSDRGGVIHWTHHDPDGSHVGGWLRHAGRTYQ